MTDERLPNTSYNAQYPYNRVTVTEGGHEVHYDDTPGRRRIRVAHGGGSYMEMSENGRRVDVTVGNHHMYSKGGVTITTDGNVDTKSKGHMRLSVGAGCHIEVTGDATIGVGGDVILNAMGNLRIGCNNLYIGARGSGEFNITGKLTVKAGSADIVSEGALNQQGSHVSLAGATYLGQGGLGGTSGGKVETETDVPSSSTFAKV